MKDNLRTLHNLHNLHNHVWEFGKLCTAHRKPATTLVKIHCTCISRWTRWLEDGTHEILNFSLANYNVNYHLYSLVSPFAYTCSSLTPYWTLYLLFVHLHARMLTCVCVSENFFVRNTIGNNSIDSLHYHHIHFKKKFSTPTKTLTRVEVDIINAYSSKKHLHTWLRISWYYVHVSILCLHVVKKIRFFKILMALPNYILNCGSNCVFRFFVSPILPILGCAFDRRKVKPVFLLSMIDQYFVRGCAIARWVS